MRKTIAASTVVITLLMCGPMGARAQNAVSPSRERGVLAGVLYDPLGQPARDVMLVLSDRASVGSMQTRTDETGRFQFDGVGAGTYSLTTPATDLITPNTVQVTSVDIPSIEARLQVDETAANVRVCRDCRDNWFRLPAAVTGVPRDERSAQAIAAPEPVEGWDAFNQQPRRYPDDLRRSRLEGTVELEGVITDDGKTADLRVTSSPDPRLAAAAVAILAQQQWRPARVRTTALQVPLHVTVEFTVDGY